VVTADIAVAWFTKALAFHRELENLEIGTVPATQQAKVSDDRAIGYVQLPTHPVSVCILDSAKRVDKLTANDFDEKPCRFLDIRHRKPDVVGSSQPGYAPLLSHSIRSVIWWFRRVSGDAGRFTGPVRPAVRLPGCFHRLDTIVNKTTKIWPRFGHSYENWIQFD
jgi:hypothetical protein